MLLSSMVQTKKGLRMMVRKRASDQRQRAASQPTTSTEATRDPAAPRR